MSINGWRLYNHAAIPSTPPNEEINTLPIVDGSIWKAGGGTPLLARWTTEFDCGYETTWWYVIKDRPFDIMALKSKRRYEINKGIKNFDVKVIDPARYAEEMYSIQVAAYSAYPKKYRPKVDKNGFTNGLANWGKYVVFGAFFRETNKMVGYAYFEQESDNYIDFKVLKTNPEYEKYSINAALVEKILSYLSSFLEGGGIICDGARSISHETKFQDYLEKYFGFRKAYCKLHIAYNPRIKWMIKLIYPVKKVLLKLDEIGIIHQVNSILKMEELVRSQ